MSKALVGMYQQVYAENQQEQVYAENQQEQVNRINSDFITKGRPIKDWQIILIPDGIWKRDTKWTGTLLLQSLKKEEDSLLNVLTSHASTGRWPDLILHEKQIFKTQI